MYNFVSAGFLRWTRFQLPKDPGKGRRLIILES